MAPELVVSDPIAALLDIVGHLDELDIAYAIGGSVASSVHGEPRASADADLIARLRPDQLDRLLARIEKTYYASQEAAHEAIRRHSSFNIIHLESMYKIDIFVAGSGRMDTEQLQRRIHISLRGDDNSGAYITAAENLILRKLDWFRQTGGASDKQWRDVLGMVKVQGKTLDLKYLQEAAQDADLSKLLDRALAECQDDD